MLITNTAACCAGLLPDGTSYSAFAGTDYGNPGLDIMAVPDTYSLEECASVCASHSTCKYFVHDSNIAYCWLKPDQGPQQWQISPLSHKYAGAVHGAATNALAPPPPPIIPPLPGEPVAKTACYQRQLGEARCAYQYLMS